MILLLKEKGEYKMTNSDSKHYVLLVSNEDSSDFIQINKLPIDYITATRLEMSQRNYPDEYYTQIVEENEMRNKLL